MLRYKPAADPRVAPTSLAAFLTNVRKLEEDRRSMSPHGSVPAPKTTDDDKIYSARELEDRLDDLKRRRAALASMK